MRKEVICSACNMFVDAGEYCNRCGQSLRKKSSKAALLILGGIVVAVVVFAFIGALLLKDTRNRQAETVTPAPVVKQEKTQPDKPLEYQLAVINAGTFVPENDITVKRFRYLLNDLQKKTGYTQQQIADLNVYAVDSLRDRYGKHVRLLDFMEQTVRPLSAAKIDYKEVVAAMIVLISKGQS